MSCMGERPTDSNLCFCCVAGKQLLGVDRHLNCLIYVEKRGAELLFFHAECRPASTDSAVDRWLPGYQIARSRIVSPRLPPAL